MKKSFLIFSTVSLTISVFLVAHLTKDVKKNLRVHMKREMPHSLSKMPFADKTGIIKKITKISLPETRFPYNSSLLPSKEGGYLLFYRYDIPWSEDHPYTFDSRIGVSQLKSDFSCSSKPISSNLIPTGHSEDPRAILWKGEYFLSYNDTIPGVKEDRAIYISELSEIANKARTIHSLDEHLKPVEKNWTPFIFNEEIHFEYSISPRKVLKWNRETECVEFLTSRDASVRKHFGWEKKWGTLRGGTPPQRIGDEYLSFFHSSFLENGINWYVMGAYTFEAKPPFTITRISRHPILFEGIYDTAIEHTSPKNVRCIFPAGLVIEEDEVHVSCGENDCATKIITFNKEKLLASLSPPYEEYVCIDDISLGMKRNCEFQEYIHGLEAERFDVKKIKGLGKILQTPSKLEDVCWDGAIGSLIQKHARPGTTVIDVGARTGIHTIALSKKVGKTGRVLSIEPEKQFLKENYWNALLNNCFFNITHLKIALGDHIHPIQLTPQDDAWVIPLDSLDLDNVSLIKMSIDKDVEKVINGSMATLSLYKPTLIFQRDHDFEKTDRLFETLKKIGYSIQSFHSAYYLALPT